MKLQHLLTLLMALLPLMLRPVQAFTRSPLTELTREELKTLESKGVFMRTIEVKDSSWPDVHIWMVIDAPALTAVGLYYALDIQKDYVPNMLESRPLLQLSPTEIHTQYEYKMPWPLPNTRCVSGTKLTSPGPDLYQITWYKVENADAKDLDGWAIFMPWQSNKSIIYYRNKVTPEGVFAGVLKKIAPQNMLDTLQAIAAYIAKTHKQSPALVEKYESYIIRALRGEYVYQAPRQQKLLK